MMNKFWMMSVAGVLAISCNSLVSAQTISLTESLSQWTRLNGSPLDENGGWLIEDGQLKHSGKGGDIYLKEPVGNFVLSFEFKVAPQGNSGIKYRVRQYGNQWLGCEFQIQDDMMDPKPRHTTGALYDLYEPDDAKRQNSPGQWNRGQIIVIGNRIEHRLNGILVVGADVGSPNWNERLQQSKFRSHEDFGANRIGRLMIQDHGSEVEFRNVMLTNLQVESESANAIADPISHISSACPPISSAHCGEACCDVCPPRRIRWNRRRGVRALRQCRPSMRRCGRW